MNRTTSVAFALSFFVVSSVVVVSRARAADAGAPAAAAGSADIDWEHMSKDQRKKYMKTKVLPEAQKIFKEFDAKAYKKVTCATCHGAGAEDGSFKMPNPKLPKLPTSREGFMALQQKKPDAVKFMGTVVKPTVAKLLNLREWTPTNPKGFGCYQCHVKEGE